MIYNIKHKIRNIFVAGLIFILPISITFIVLNFLFVKLDAIFAPFLWRLLDLIPASERVPGHFPGFGIGVTIILIFASGVFVKNVVGKHMVSWSEYLLYKIPLASSIYKASKQFLEGISTSGKKSFRSVVLIEFPRRGTYAIGFVTGVTEGEVQEITEETLVNIFVPTTPNPTSGYLSMVPKNEVRYLDMSVEDGIKMVISGGVITPRHIPKKD